MKKIISVCLMVLLPNFLVVMPLNAAGSDQTSNKTTLIIKSEKKSVFKGFLYRIWGKLRAISPRATKSRRSVATAGIRGAETTTSIISPYWKDDNTNDPQYLKELSAFTSAQQLAEDGDLPAAITALSSFIAEYSDSDYRANAQFALGISYGGIGKNEESVNAFQNFVNDYPKHPLVGDAKQVMAELR